MTDSSASVDHLIERGLRVVWVRNSERYPDTLLPEIDMLGWSSFPETQIHGLGPHQHDGFEICYLVDGEVEWWVEGDAIPYRVRSGDIFLTRPGEWHGGTDTMMHPCVLYWVQVQLTPNAFGLTASEGNALIAGLSGKTRRQFPAHGEIGSLFQTLIDEHSRNRSSLAVIAAQAALQLLLVQVIRYQAGANASEPSRYSPEIARALEWMEARLGEPFAIEEAAGAVGLTPTRFHERFRREIGQTPADWRIRHRVERARSLLARSDCRVTEVAFAVGFASSQHFATAFKRYTGRTPTQYRRSLLSSPGESSPE